MEYLKHIKQGLKPGIYFDLPEADYHADTAISKSNVMDLLRHELVYWKNSWLNPQKRKQEPSKEMEYGTMVHCLLLQKELFDKKYIVQTGYGMDYARKPVTIKEYNSAVEMVNSLYEDRRSKIYLTEGYPEVTIVWQDELTGVMYRIRIDYLTILAITDYKTIYSLEKIGWDSFKYGYDIQSAHYTLGALAARKMLREGKQFHIQGVKGKFHKRWLEEFVLEEEMWFRTLFQEKEDPYLFEYHEFSEFHENSIKLIILATDRYVKMLSKYGTSKPPANIDSVKTVNMFNTPKYLYTRGIEGL